MVKKDPRDIGEIDIQIGIRIKDARLARDLGLRSLGALIGVSGGQLRKYEYGINRISASRLLVVARALNTPIELFYLKPT